MRAKKLRTMRWVFMVVMLCFAVGLSVQAKSLYVISNMHGAQIQAYGIVAAPTYLEFQFEATVPDPASGATGLAIDSVSEILFVTYENSNTIQLLSKDLEDLGTTTAPDATNLAGIAVDEAARVVYTIDRYTPKLYAYDWDAATKTLTLQAGFPRDLPGATCLWGIALDESNQMLYVTNAEWSMPEDPLIDAAVHWYDTATWTLQGSFIPSAGPVGIAIDSATQVVFTGGAWFDNVLSRWDLGSSTEITVDLGDMYGAMGIAIDNATGLVYVTHGYDGDNITVRDPATIAELHATAAIGEKPTGIAIPTLDIGYNPGEPTTTTVIDDPDPSVINTDACFTATVSPADATGTVTFLEGTTVLGTGTLSGGVATFCTSVLTLGAHTITARYEGDSVYAGSSGTEDHEVINRVPEIDVQRPSSIPDGGTDDIGDTPVGLATLTYTIDNTVGTAQLDITCATASNYANSSGFALISALPINIAAGGTGTMQISFNVNLIGPFSFDMDVCNNDPNEDPYDITIQGVGVVDLNGDGVDDVLDVRLVLAHVSGCSSLTGVSLDRADIDKDGDVDMDDATIYAEYIIGIRP